MQSTCPYVDLPGIRSRPTDSTFDKIAEEGLSAARVEQAKPTELRPVSIQDKDPTAKEYVWQPVFNEFGWPVPSSILPNPSDARAAICLPEFDPFLLERARVIAGHFAAAQAEIRRSGQKANRYTDSAEHDLAIPHFERVFQMAAEMGGVEGVVDDSEYDTLLVVSAWHAVRPGGDGFLGSFPKAVLCPLSHLSPPSALATLSARDQESFSRRAPAYLRCLMAWKFNLRTCADIENSDLRHLLRSTGFRLVKASAAAEMAYPGITHGEDPPVRPWKLTLRQELTEDRAVELLTTAALWKIVYDLRLVTSDHGRPHWNLGVFGRTDWEDAFLSLGVRIPQGLMRESGLFDWRALLDRCIQIIGAGNLPSEVLGKVLAWPQRICHDDHEAIWEGLDQVSRLVMERVRGSEPQLFLENGWMNGETARGFRRWARLFDEISPQILSRFGVSAFTALRRVAPEYFGWGCDHLKPWELEQEHGKWKGPRGRALLRSAYAYALYEAGLGVICQQDDEIFWQCDSQHLTDWCRSAFTAEGPYRVLYGLASRHGLTPLLNRDVTHTGAVSLMAGMNLHANLPRIEGCWELCMRTAIGRNGGTLEVRLEVPDLVPLPLRLRNAVLASLTYGYLHKEIRLVRDFDLRMAREARRKLEEIPGWWEDERISGTGLLPRVDDPDSECRGVLKVLRPDPWLELPEQRTRFRALQLLLSKRAVLREEAGQGGLTSAEIRTLLRLAFEGALQNCNLAQVSLPAVQRGFERILARADTREMLDSLLMHVGTAYETEIWGRVRKFMVLDAINDLVGLAVRCSLLHRMVE